jgi:hypothetical protein
MTAGFVRLSSHGLEGEVRSLPDLAVLEICIKASLVTSWEPKEFARR